MTDTAVRGSSAGYQDGAARERFFTPRRFITPLIVAVVLGALVLWLSSLQLDSIEKRTLNIDYIINRTREHLGLTIVASALVAILAIPTGIALSRTKSKVVRGIVLGIANIGQATPAIGVIILLAIVWQTGYATALTALVIYSFLPVLRNTLIGLQQVDENVRESARGMGMTPNQVLRDVELPLAVPVILAGLRVAAVTVISITVVAAYVNAGGLGTIIFAGMSNDHTPKIWVGALAACGLSVGVDLLLSAVETRARRSTR